jgi:hypothetical protein
MKTVLNILNILIFLICLIILIEVRELKIKVAEMEKELSMLDVRMDSLEVFSLPVVKGVR